ncbi:Pentatricopeptide repeat-containing protein [Dioscorea alata]|uniref:Pentatricopeptide repeat-containing protein n=1 Tax=Dioscorea alata TaxID=55571 RepID=A0ACB7VHY7_DIOAL|nr:Pentatricopeptide repeat-containing protein [Dioscorea alata]
MKCLKERFFPYYCNSIIRASLEKGSPQNALQTYKALLSSAILRPDHRTLVIVLKACRISSNLHAMMECHAKIIKAGLHCYMPLSASIFKLYLVHDHIADARHMLDGISRWDPDPVYGNLMLMGLFRNKEFDMAYHVFGKMPKRDLVSWNSMIEGCLRCSRPKVALKLFRRMLDAGLEPDGFTFSTVFSACARVGALSHGRWAHQLMAEKQIELNHIIVSALIDMYAKCGRIEIARKIFDGIKRNNVSVWNSMITGLAIHGLGAQVFDVFSLMENEGVAPDGITFVGILTACSHCGLVEECRQYFNAMRHNYLIEPKIEHYGAMVDTLARAGLLYEAYETIKTMAMEPDTVIWRALLSACRKHRQADLAETVIRHMAQGKQSGDYVLLSSIYSSAKQYRHAETVWRLMKEKGIRKNRGLSWVEMGSVIHQFKAGDRSHRESEAIYRVLDDLMGKAKAHGFAPVTELVTMDVLEEEKEENLQCHSEKLAVAYSVLKTSPGMEIRVSKNLRTCLDCHEWMKMVSKVLCKVILVRDRIRFHRFENGSCLCNDYW